MNEFMEVHEMYHVPDEVFIGERRPIMAKPTSRQMQEFWAQVEKGRVTTINFQEFITDPEWKSIFEVFDETYRVNVDYTKSVQAMLELAKFDSIYKNLTFDDVKVEGKGQKKIKVRIISLKGATEIQTLKEKLRERKMRLATFEELLTLAASHPDLQRKFSIASIGTTIECLQLDRNHTAFPSIMGRQDIRWLSITDYAGCWTHGFKIAVVTV